MMDKHTDGFDLCYNLKHDESCRKIPIMMVTAVTDKTGLSSLPKRTVNICRRTIMCLNPSRLPNCSSG